MALNPDFTQIPEQPRAAKACCTVGLVSGLLGGVVLYVSEFQSVEWAPTGFLLDRIPNFVFNTKPIKEI